MSFLSNLMTALGVMSCLYATARFLHYLSLKLQDSEQGSVLTRLLTLVCIGLWIISLPVTAILSILDRLHTDRLRELIRRDAMHTAELLYRQPPQKPQSQAKILNFTDDIFDTVADSLVKFASDCLTSTGHTVTVPALLAICTAVIHSTPLVQDYRDIRRGLEISIEHRLGQMTSSYPHGQYETMYDDATDFWSTLDWENGNSRCAAEAAVRHIYPNQNPDKSLVYSIVELIQMFGKYFPQLLNGYCIMISTPNTTSTQY